MRVLEIPLYDKGLNSGILEIIESFDDPIDKTRCISATGAHGLVISKQDIEFKKILEEFYLNLPDGMPAVWMGKIKGASRMERCYGPDFCKQFLIKSASNKKIKHFFCGGKEGVAKKLAEVANSEFGNKNIAGTYCPPFKNIEDYNFREIAEKINESGATFIWIGLSTPKQEQFAYNLSKHTQANYVACIGAAFDFHIGTVRQAPKWVQKIGMEWFFRLITEPSRLWKRYLEIVPLFIYYNFAELLTGKFYKR